MKRIIILVSVLALVPGLAFGQKSNIAGTPHDIDLPSGSSGCTVCHSPHNSTSTLNTILLWNPAAAGGPYNTYTGSNGIATGTALSTPTGITDPQFASFLCLSCHDGTTATTNFGAGGVLFGAVFNGTLSDVGATPAAQPNLGDGTLVTNTGATPADTDLTNDHPVNFTYPDPIPAGLEFDTRANAEAAGLEFFGPSSDSMQCATCHDPHDQNSAGNGFYLRTATTTTVDFCTSCHL